MAITNHERVGKAMELLNAGLSSFVERELKASFDKRWLEEVKKILRDYQVPKADAGSLKWDIQALLSVMIGKWEDTFRRTLGKAERTLVHELSDIRNKWAHQETFSS